MFATVKGTKGTKGPEGACMCARKEATDRHQLDQQSL